MRTLTSAERKYLRGLAQRMDPVVYVGKAGLSDSVVESADLALEAHELVKVRFIDHKDEKDEITQVLAERTGAQVAGRIGHVAIIYRQNPDEDKRRIDLDEAGR